MTLSLFERHVIFPPNSKFETSNQVFTNAVVESSPKAKPGANSYKKHCGFIRPKTCSAINKRVFHIFPASEPTSNKKPANKRMCKRCVQHCNICPCQMKLIVAPQSLMSFSRYPIRSSFGLRVNKFTFQPPFSGEN